MGNASRLEASISMVYCWQRAGLATLAAALALHIFTSAIVFNLVWRAVRLQVPALSDPL